MYFEKLYTLPQLHRNEEEGKYYYEEKYVGKIFEINDKFVFIKENSHFEIPELAVSNIIEAIMKTTISPEALNDLKTDYTTSIKKLAELITKMSIEIKELKNNKPSIDFEEIYDKIEEKINTVMTTKKKENKINITTLMMLKEAGFSTDDIAALGKEGLL